MPVAGRLARPLPMTLSLNYPPRLSLAHTPTPLTPLAHISAELDFPVWCKRDDLTGSVLSGNKIRKLEFVLAEALAQGADTLVTCGGLQSNHCRTTALLAATHGLGCELILRGERPAVDDGNLLLAAMAGACIHTYPAARYRRDMNVLRDEHLQRLRHAGRRPFWIPTGASDGVGIWGYVDAARELAEDCRAEGIERPLVVCAAGSGGTLAGLAAGLEHYLPRAQVLGVAVCDSAAYFKRRVAEDVAACLTRYDQCGLAMPTNFRVVEDYIGPGYAQADPCIYQLMARLARQEGLVLDQVYTAKAFYGMLQEWRKGLETSIQALIFVHTGGVFGLFPEREQVSRFTQ